MSDVIETLTAHSCCEIVRATEVDAFLARNPLAILFFTGDVVRRPEGLDVAVVVREIATSYGERLRIGLIDGRDEAALMARYGVVMAPAVAWMRDGQPAEIVARMRDWSVYAAACDRLLTAVQPGSLTGIGGNA